MNTILYVYSLFCVFFFSVLCVSVGFVTALEQTGILLVGAVVLGDVWRMIVETFLGGE